jgi:hypothetical protein
VTSAQGGAHQPPLSASTARQICRSVRLLRDHCGQRGLIAGPLQNGHSVRLCADSFSDVHTASAARAPALVVDVPLLQLPSTAL